MNLFLSVALVTPALCAAPSVSEKDGFYVVQGSSYRAIFRPETLYFDLELYGADRVWHEVCLKPGMASCAYFVDGQEQLLRDARATWAVRADEIATRIGQQSVLTRLQDTTISLEFICVDAGVLMSAQLEPAPQSGTFWCPPRFWLSPEVWDGYAYWDGKGRKHEGRMSALGVESVYAGVSPWGNQGDTVHSLDPQHPALIIRSETLQAALGIVYMNYAQDWTSSHMFVQRHTPTAAFVYAGYTAAAASAERRWAWVAPMPEPAGEAARIEELRLLGEKLLADFYPVAQAVPDSWKQPVADFLPDLRRSSPVRDICEAVVYTINEYTSGDYGIDLARKVGSDVLVRAWFKWHEAPPVHEQTEVPQRAHALGALFGGGITCSALYDGENGLSEEQWRDMATRGPAGQLIEAWNQPGTRHGTLSNPAYLDYLFRWCREQIDAGADYLFMDEINAALGPLEGYDDYSLADFREYLLGHAPQTQGWVANDERWAGLGIDLADRELCPDGTMASFDYRAFLRKKGFLDNPTTNENPLAYLWGQFRAFRDDRAWKSLTDRIRTYARERGQTVYVSANGLAPYVDLQVLGVWGHFKTHDGHIDLTENQIPVWRATVLRGHDLAGKRVPVVFFHDWGFGDPPFPFMALPPSERELWHRVRGAEIYAAGAFYAFPVLGPFGCDAARDGTLREIARQTTFYQRHRELYLRGRYVGSESVVSDTPNLSLAAWWREDSNQLLLHVINRELDDYQLVRRENVTLSIPVDALPRTVSVVSPDSTLEATPLVSKQNEELYVVLPSLEAYSVAVLQYDGAVDLSRLADPVRVRPDRRWQRPMRNEFVVRPDRSIEHASDLNGFLQGRLHTFLRNPPTFLINASEGGTLHIMVQAVAALGARIEYRVDGEFREGVDLPDRDGKNDAEAAEYNRLLTFSIPVGRHRVTVENTGQDWASISYYEFQGKFEQW